MAAILGVEVLDDLLAPRVLEVDIDVGRLGALARDEALEQHRHARRVDLGDAEAVADRRVGGRAAALAEDAATARELDEVVDRQEIRLVAELGDEREFVLDQRAYIGRHAVARREGRGGGAGRRHDAAAAGHGGRKRRSAPAPRRAAFDELAQPLGGGAAFGHDLARVLVAQFVEREAAARRDGERLGEQRGWVEPRKPHAVAQVALARGQQREPGILDRGAETDGGERIVQPPPRADMHAHRPRRDQRQTVRGAERGERREMGALGAVTQQLGGDPCGPGVMRAQPGRRGFERCRSVDASGR